MQYIYYIRKKYVIMYFFVAHVVLDSPPQAVAHHLRWILQKDLLGQDMFLIGPPGPLRRSIAMQYLVRQMHDKMGTFTRGVYLESCSLMSKIVEMFVY